MNNSEVLQFESKATISKIPVLAAVVALIGIVDAVYLTIHHYTAEPVPCSIISGCEQVLTSSYAEMFGIPTAAFGALAYLTAFILASISIFGNRFAWTLYGVAATTMAAFSIWLIYVQGFVIEAFCQFCLISAATSLTLFVIFLVSKFVRSK